MAVITEEQRRRTTGAVTADPRVAAEMLAGLGTTTIDEAAEQIVTPPVAPVPQTIPSEQPELSAYLAQPEQPEGGLGKFLNDPRTIAATIFGLAALNSDSENMAGAFLEGLGAVGSAQSAQRQRTQQEFENTQTEQRAQQVETQLAGVEADREQQGRYKKAEILLGQQTNMTRIMTALVAAESETKRTGAMSKQQSKALQAILLKDLLSDAAYNDAKFTGAFEGTREEYQAQQFKRLEKLDPLFPELGLKKLVETIQEEPKPPVATVAKAKGLDTAEEAKAVGVPVYAADDVGTEAFLTLKELGMEEQAVKDASTAERYKALRLLGYGYKEGKFAKGQLPKTDIEETGPTTSLLTQARKVAGLPEAQAEEQTSTISTQAEHDALTKGERYYWKGDSRLRVKR